MENQTALAVVPNKGLATASFEPQTISEAMDLARVLATSSLLPEPLRGKAADVLIVLMTGRELGLSPMQSIRNINVVKGKGVLDAALIVGLCLKHKDTCHHFTMIESTDKSATYEAQRVGSEPVRLTFTIEQAQKANLTGKGNWQTFPAAMLRARCSSHLARTVFPDLVAGLYDNDEGEAIRGDERPAKSEPRKVRQVSEQKPQPKPEPALETKPEPTVAHVDGHEVIEGTVVAQATTETGRVVRIVDAPPDQPEPPPPSDEHAPSTAAPVEDGPTLCDDLLAELKSLTEAKALGEWIERCRAGEKRGGLKPEEMLTLKAAYKSHCSSLSKKGGSK